MITSAIEWTNATWNPWQGCTKISPACAHCYMFEDMKRYGRDGANVVRSSPQTFNLPTKRKRDKSHAIPPGHKVFTCSWSDWFHERADAWRPEAWPIIKQRPDLIFQIVTKRTDRILDHLPEDWGTGWPNVWIIATVEDQARAQERLPQLLRVPAVVRGVSYEPALEAVDFTPWLRPIHEDEIETTNRGPQPAGPFHDPWIAPIDWIIAGGESGHQARRCDVQWLASTVQQCQAHGAACFVKQLGSKPGKSIAGTTSEEYTGRDWIAYRLNDRKGGDPSEWPPGLNVRQFPTPRAAPCCD